MEQDKIKIVISGPQGSGKSQLLRLLAGAIKVAKLSGSLAVGEVEMTTTTEPVLPVQYDERDYA
jgi:ABC-type thiamine transport system ATPase subunit